MRWAGTPRSWAGCRRSRGENGDGYAWLWGDIEVSAAALEGRDPGQVRVLLAREVEGNGQQWLDVTDDGALIVCARGQLDIAGHFAVPAPSRTPVSFGSVLGGEPEAVHTRTAAGHTRLLAATSDYDRQDLLRPQHAMRSCTRRTGRCG